MDDGIIHTNLDEDLTLRAWEGDDSVKGEILLAHGVSIEKSISRRLPERLRHYAEDIVCEAIARFWASREKYDGAKPLRAYLFVIARNVATDLVTGKLKRQKAHISERSVDYQLLDSLAHPIEAELDQIEEENSEFFNALRESLDVLSDIERDVIEAFGLADNNEELNAAQLGIELGEKHENGVPIPKGHIRQHKFRGKSKLAKAMRDRGYDIENPKGKKR